MALIIAGRIFHRTFGKVHYRSEGGSNGGNGGNGGGDGGNGGYQTIGTTGTAYPRGTSATSTTTNGTTTYTPGTYTPAAGYPMPNYPGAKTTPPPAAPYWRLNITAVQQAGQKPGLSYIAMFDNQANSLLQYNAGFDAINGTAISSPGNTDPRWAFYQAPSVSFPGWQSLQADIGYIGFHFNTPVSVARLAYQGYINVPQCSPRNFTVEYSQDGENWTVANTYVDEISAVNHRFRTAVTDASTLPHQNVQVAPIAYPMPTGLVAAYALRVIVPGYTGPLISVETDLYGTVDVYPTAGGNLDVDFLQAVMNANGSIGVSKWWDQSGHGRTAIVTNVAACPLIIEGGITTTSVNSRPGLHFYPEAPFDLPFGPLQNGGVTFQTVFMNLETTNWPTIVANQLTDGNTASIGIHRDSHVLDLFRNGQADSPTSLVTSLGTTAIMSATWFQGADNTVTGGFSLNGKQANPVTLSYSAPANARGRVGQSFQVANGLGGDAITKGYISEMLFYPAAGADTAGSLTALSNYFGIPLTP